jgi:TRAP-type C4-dicarboxylate transport system substrate-binding protein
VFALVAAVAFLTVGAADTAGAAEQLKWRMAQTHPVDSDYDKRAKSFAKKVEERTKGRIHIDVFSGNSLGDWTETFEMNRRGTLEVNLGQANSNFGPELDLAYYFPYLVKDVDEARKVYGKDGWAYKVIQGLWEKYNMKALAVVPVGMSGVSLRTKPDNYADPTVPKNMKVRVMPIKACELTYEAMGYIATPIPYAEAYSAIQTGIADGQMGGPPFQAWQFKDVNKVWIQYNDFFESWWFTVNLDLWNKLSKEDQEILQAAALEESDIQWDRATAVDEEYRQKLKDEYGWEIVILTPEELTNIADHVRKTVWPSLEQSIGKELMDKVYQESGIPRP